RVIIAFLIIILCLYLFVRCDPVAYFIDRLPLWRNFVSFARHAKMEESDQRIVFFQAEKFLRFFVIRNTASTQISAYSIRRSGQVHILNSTKHRPDLFYR